MTNLNVAENIMRALRPLLVPFGIKNLLGGENELLFDIVSRYVGRSGSHRVQVILDPTDTYTVKLWKLSTNNQMRNGAEPCVVVREVSDIYVEDLVDAVRNVCIV